MCFFSGDGTYDVDIEANEPGPHKVDLFLRNKEIPTMIEHVKDFPKIIQVEPGVDAKKTLCEGPGLAKTGLIQDHETYFDIITRDAKVKTPVARLEFFNVVCFLSGPQRWSKGCWSAFPGSDQGTPR